MNPQIAHAFDARSRGCKASVSAASSFARSGWFAFALILATATSACKRQDDPAIRREALANASATSTSLPPARTATASAASTASAGPGACEGGGGSASDSVSQAFFPAKIADYCIDPHGEVRTFGENAKYSMDKVCTTAFDGECEVYKTLGLQRVVSLHYIADKSSGIVDIIVSRFAKDGAYAMFTKRVVADGDPNTPTTPRPMAAGGAGAIGTGRAYVWRGDYLVELQYNNEEQAPREVKKSSDTILPLIAAAIGTQLPLRGKSDADDLPTSVSALPSAARVVNGVQFYPREAPLLGRLGATAIGFYRDASKRYQVAALARDDEAQARDVIKSIRAKGGASRVEYLGDEAFAVVFTQNQGDLKSEWVFARKGARVFGVGDDEFALRAEESTSKRDAARIGREAAAALLKELLAQPVAPAATAAQVPPTHR